MLYIVSPSGVTSFDVEIILCDTFLSRFSGAMFQRRIDNDEGYWFPGVGSVHTMMMGEPISLIYYGEEGRVLRYRRKMEPHRVSWGPSGTRGVLELNYDRPGDVISEGRTSFIRFSQELCERAGEPALAYGDSSQ